MAADWRKRPLQGSYKPHPVLTKPNDMNQPLVNKNHGRHHMVRVNLLKPRRGFSGGKRRMSWTVVAVNMVRWPALEPTRPCRQTETEMNSVCGWTMEYQEQQFRDVRIGSLTSAPTWPIRSTQLTSRRSYRGQRPQVGLSLTRIRGWGVVLLIWFPIWRIVFILLLASFCMSNLKLCGHFKSKLVPDFGIVHKWWLHIRRKHTQWEREVETNILIFKI